MLESRKFKSLKSSFELSTLRAAPSRGWSELRPGPARPETRKMPAAIDFKRGPDVVNRADAACPERRPRHSEGRRYGRGNLGTEPLGVGRRPARPPQARSDRDLGRTTPRHARPTTSLMARWRTITLGRICE